MSASKALHGHHEIRTCLEVFLVGNELPELPLLRLHFGDAVSAAASSDTRYARSKVSSDDKFQG